MKLKLLSLILAATLGGQVAAKDVRIGIDPTYEPFEYKTPDGKLAGFSVDLAQALCAEIKARCSFVESDWAGIIPGLKAKKYDIIMSSMSITDERKKTIDFTGKYYKSPFRLIGKAGTSVKSPPELKGKTVGVMRSTNQEKFAKVHYASAGAKIVSYDNANSTYLDLKSGRIDFLLAEAVGTAQGFLDKPDGKGYAFVSEDLQDDAILGYGAGIATRKGDPLRGELDAALTRLHANGTWKKISDRYFPNLDIWGK